MTVLMTGATGFVGAHTAAALHRAGHPIRLLVRDAAKAERVAAATGFPADDLVVGDVMDGGSVERALRGCTSVVHSAGAVSLDRRQAATTMAVNTAGANNVLGMAADQGLRRIVHVSSTSALDTSSGRPLTGTERVSTVAGYASSKAAAEKIARELQSRGAPVTITYPAGVIGPAAGESLGETSSAMARFVAAGIMPSPHAAISIVDVRDLAEVHRSVIDTPDPPGRIMCGGTHLPLRDFGAHLHSLTGRRFLVLPVPAGVLRGAGRLADLISAPLPIELPLNAESMSTITTWPGTEDNISSTLGIQCRPVIDTLTDAIRAWFDAGLLTRRHAGRLASTPA